MKEFELKLGGTTYKCSAGISDATSQNWAITAETGGFKLSIVIPIETKQTRAQAMCFVEAFHEAFMEAKKKQGLQDTYR